MLKLKRNVPVRRQWCRGDARGGVCRSGAGQDLRRLFTPPFGGAFPDLEWSGSGKFYIPDACEALPTGWKANSGRPAAA